MHFRSSQGFTTFELMIVALVAIVVFTIGVPQVRQTLSASKLDTSARQLSTDLNFARNAAVSRNSVYRLVINSANRTFELVDPVLGDRIRSPRTLETGIRFETVPQQAVQFFPRGHARPGTVVLRDEFGRRVGISVRASGLVIMGPFGQSYD